MSLLSAAEKTKLVHHFVYVTQTETCETVDNKLNAGKFSSISN